MFCLDASDSWEDNVEENKKLPEQEVLKEEEDNSASEIANTSDEKPGTLIICK